MYKIKKAFNEAIYFLLIPILSTFVSVKSGTDDPSCEVVGENPAEEIVRDVRLAFPENHWDGYGKAIGICKDMLIVGAPGRNGFGSNPAYVYRFKSHS